MKTKFNLSNFSTLILTTLCLLTAFSAQSAIQFFNGTNAVLNWDNGITPNWGNVTGGPYNITWANGNDALFQGTAGTMTNLGVSAHSPTPLAMARAARASGVSVPSEKTEWQCRSALRAVDTGRF